jgi:hypothetical protein
LVGLIIVGGRRSTIFVVAKMVSFITVVMYVTILFVGIGSNGVVAVCPPSTLRVVVPLVSTTTIPTQSLVRLAQQLRNTPVYGYGACPLNISRYTSEVTSINGGDTEEVVVYDNNNIRADINHATSVPYDVAIVPSLTAYALRRSSESVGNGVYQLLSIVRSWQMTVTAYEGTSPQLHTSISIHAMMNDMV